MNKTATIRIDAAQYEDHDDCLTAAADDAARKFNLAGWNLNPRWEDDERDGIIIDVPAHVFLDTGDSRETSPELMEAILQVADGDIAEANRIWEDPTDREITAIVEIVTGNGRTDPTDYVWGAAGTAWGQTFV